MQTDPVPVPTVNPSKSDSISTAMQTLALAHGQENVDEAVVDETNGIATMKPKPKPKPKQKGKQTVDGDDISAGVQRSNRHGKEI
jgi:hypothetical protein